MTGLHASGKPAEAGCRTGPLRDNRRHPSPVHGALCWRVARPFMAGRPGRDVGPPASIGSRHPPTFILHPTMSDLVELERRALDELQACADEAALRAWNSRYFGEQGAVTEALGK